MGLAAALGATGALCAQTVPDQPNTASALDIPENLQIFGKVDPNVRKPTAIVNDTVITGTDVDQRAALLIAANNLKLSAEDRDRLRLQVLRNLIDETLQIQEAKTAQVTITQSEIDQSYARIARGFGRTPAQMSTYLREAGSSDRSLRRQIEGELAWQRFLQRRVEPLVNVGEEEVKGILDRLQASKGTEEYHLKEIYLSATPDRAEQVYANARRMIEQIQKGEAPFEYLARQYSESSTRAVGGDLDWVRLNTLPESLSAAAQQMQVGQIAGPVETPGGMSILYLVDKRQVLTSDSRDARLQLKQLTIRFPAGTTQAQATTRAAAFAKATQAINGCGEVNRVAGTIDAEVVDSDAVVVRDLPPALQEILLKLQIGQATPPFGSPEQGVRSLVLCGREDPQNGGLPNPEQVQAQMEQARVNLRAQQMLRDLRRDAIVEYR
ncbi:peptidylprolyl isomerase [Sphingomonas aracearum]|uniref:Parvulin-like PPIase n=2 Tax=Sphingomonas aracearum TaxID=2283317 RepID=A0A369W032_9SPHN|nr:peptidylprolyl isomerase [Sphingomonas aracearum]